MVLQNVTNPWRVIDDTSYYQELKKMLDEEKNVSRLEEQKESNFGNIDSKWCHQNVTWQGITFQNDLNYVEWKCKSIWVTKIFLFIECDNLKL